MNALSHMLSRLGAARTESASSKAPEEKPASSRADLNIRFMTEFPTCNLSCSYCIAGHGTAFAKPASTGWNAERYRTIMRNIAQLPYNVNMRIGVAGEFFVSKVLIDEARLLSNASNITSLNLITNLTFSIKQYDAIFKGYCTDRLAVVASFHPEQIADHEAWFQKAAEFGRRYDFAVVMVAFPTDLAEIASYKARLNELGVSVFTQPFIGPHNGVQYPEAYTDEQRAQLRDLIYSRHDYEYLLNVKKPGMCNAGYRSIFVDPFGKVTPCGMGAYKTSLGDLSESPHLDLRRSASPCPFRACQCDTENINTVDFEGHYERIGKNQHRYRYRFAELASFDSRYDEWSINY